MKRLFVKIKTDPRIKGTLFEIGADSIVSETLKQITKGMEILPTASHDDLAPDYQFVRLGSPKRILEKQQTFSQNSIENNDTLLITLDPDSVMSQGLFDFESLSLENQYVSVQDLRAPLRMPLPGSLNETRKKIKEALNEVGTSDVDEYSSAQPTQTRESSVGFDFQPLDIDLSTDRDSSDARSESNE